jgi:hypothetical protein
MSLPEFSDIDRIYASRISPVSKNEKQNISVCCAINRSRVRETFPTPDLYCTDSVPEEGTMCSQPKPDVAVLSVQNLGRSDISGSGCKILEPECSLEQVPLPFFMGH